MRRIAIAMLISIMLISLSGCVRLITLTGHIFGTLDELKAKAGDQLLYPVAMPPGGFEPTFTEISGYNDYTTWNYRIVLRDDVYANNPKHADWAWRNAPPTVPEKGSPAAAYIYIYAFVPREYHIVGGRSTQWPNMWEEIDAYNSYIGWVGENIWDIGGAEVSYRTGFSAVPEKTDDSGELVPAYACVDTYAGFMRSGLLYVVETRVYGHPDEAEEVLTVMAEGMIRTIMAEMILGS